MGKSDQAGSLASLLSMGKPAEKETDVKPEEKKQPQWQSVWDRSGSKLPSGTLNAEQMSYFQEMQAENEKYELERDRIRQQVEKELSQAGAFSEEMYEQAFEKAWKDYELQRLLRPQDLPSAQTSGAGKT